MAASYPSIDRNQLDTAIDALLFMNIKWAKMESFLDGRNRPGRAVPDRHATREN